MGLFAKRKNREENKNQLNDLSLLFDKNTFSISSRKMRKQNKIISKMNEPHKGTKILQNSPNYVIELENVSKWVVAVDKITSVLKDVNLRVKKSDFIVILGPSGSGKTTLINIMSGMDRASNGQVIVNNHNLITMSNTALTKFRKKYIGFIFQQYGLLPKLKVRENIELGARLQTDYQLRLDVDEVIKTLGIYEHILKYPYQISGGQQQRVAIARAMVKNPVILFGDEPTGAVDTRTSKLILQMFLDINKIYKTTIVLVTHNPIIAQLAHKVIKLDHGKIVEIYEQNPAKLDDLDWSQIDAH